MPRPQPKGVWTQVEHDVHGGHVVLVVDGKTVHHFYEGDGEQFLADVRKDLAQAAESRRQRTEVIAADRRAEGYV